MDHDTDYATYVRESWDALVRSAVFLGCGLHEAEDLVQTVLVRCYTAWTTVAAADNRDAYVYRMLINALRDSKRRRWWGERPSERLPDAGLPDPTDSVATIDAVHRALAGLSKVNRDVVVLRYFTGLSERQTAEVLDVPPGTVKSRLSRSLAQLATDDHLADLRPGFTEVTP
ncbi:SigE family RNA polymerase sigma factor [Nocardioides sp. C4-1]|uniref:SigE family RNA polymerase sigma factor n=1 Tax=Nocardioides sp. C4-1 TaxID=3151851 RepID=UPI003264E397